MIQKIKLKNFTVFEDFELEFSQGINVFIGENGTGKTHLMKLIYAACKSGNPKVSFSQKIVSSFLPEDYKINRLISRKKDITSAEVKITGYSKENTKNLAIDFNEKTKKWDGNVKYEQSWESEFKDVEAVFIPAKEILSNSYNIISANEKNNVEFDDTYIDVIHSAKVNISEDENLEFKKMLQSLEKIMDGKVLFDAQKDKFYITYRNSRLEFNLVAEGIRKIALIWQLISNGVIRKGSILFWDEPEANINPIYIPLLVDIMITLQKNGIQLFISTHDYTLAKYFDIKTNEENIKFHSLYKTEDGVKCETNSRFKNLEKNTIRDTFIQLYKDEIQMEMGL